MSNPILDITLIPTYSTKTIGFADITAYSNNYPINNPTIEITVPGYRKISLGFNPKSVNIFNGNNFGMCKVIDIKSLPSIPDGIYTIKYSISPNNTLFVEKSFIRVELLECKYANAFLKLDLNECDNEILSYNKEILRKIRLFIDGSIALANTCDLDGAIKLYQKANEMLDKFNNTDCFCR